MRLTLLPANLACLRRLVRAVCSAMTGLLADATGSRELALDARVGAVGLVVANFAAVEAFPGEAAARWCVGAFASEVAFCAAAAKNVSMVSG